MKTKLSKYNYLMMLGHVCADLTQGALPAILPFLIAQGNLSYTSATGLVFASGAVSSLVQPVFGYLGDKASGRWLMALGVFMSGAGLAVMGFMDSYAGKFIAVAISGIGVALFHPEGGKTANLVAGEHKGRGMGLFGAGGNIGFTVGPLMASAVMVGFGVKGTLAFLFPGLIIAIVLLCSLKGLNKYMADNLSPGSRTGTSNNQKNDWRGFARAISVVFCRSILYNGVFVFIPLYWVSVLHQSEASGSIKLTVLAGAGIVATLIGGQLADRFGFAKLIRILTIALLPCLVCLLLTDSILLATILLIPIAFCLSGPYSAMIALAQSFLPKNVGFASGITLGLSVSVGGMFSPVIGKIADTYGIPASMYFLVGVTVVAIICSFILPKTSAK